MLPDQAIDFREVVVPKGKGCAKRFRVYDVPVSPAVGLLYRKGIFQVKTWRRRWFYFGVGFCRCGCQRQGENRIAGKLRITPQADTQTTSQKGKGNEKFGVPD